MPHCPRGAIHCSASEYQASRVCFELDVAYLVHRLYAQIDVDQPVDYISHPWCLEFVLLEYNGSPNEDEESQHPPTYLATDGSSDQPWQSILTHINKMSRAGAIGKVERD